MKIDHIVEPELRQGLPPRPIKTKGGLWGDFKPFWWILLPHTWIAVAAPIVLAWFCVMHFCPDVRTEGTVIRHYTTTGSKGGLVNHLVYQYNIKGTRREEDETVSADLYNAADAGKPTVTVSAIRNPLSGNYIAHINDESAELFPLAFGAVWTFIWCGAIGGFAWSACSPYMRSSQLVRFGIPVAGTITGTRTKTQNRKQVSLVAYAYEAKSDDGGMRHTQKYTGEMQVPDDQLDTIHADEIVTVLYDEKKPKRSIVYKYALHEACR